MSELLPLPIEAISVAPNLASRFGDTGTLGHVRVADLRIDPKYQRDVLRRGRAHVHRIVKGFSWSLFSPLVVCRRPGGLYAVIDGQHRACAAAVLGISYLPAWIITGTPEDEAKAFAVINGQVTSIMPTQVFHAQLAAGDNQAIALQDACSAAGVTILRVPRVPMRVGDTMCIKSLETCFAEYGRETLITALMCITQTDDGNPNMVRADLVKALCLVLHHARGWRDAGEALFAAIEAVGLQIMLENAQRKATDGDKPKRFYMIAEIREALERASAQNEGNAA